MCLHSYILGRIPLLGQKGEFSFVQCTPRKATQNDLVPPERLGSSHLTTQCLRIFCSKVRLSLSVTSRSSLFLLQASGLGRGAGRLGLVCGWGPRHLRSICQLQLFSLPAPFLGNSLHICRLAHAKPPFLKKQREPLSVKPQRMPFYSVLLICVRLIPRLHGSVPASSA